ncbi:MAG: hypothetical protein P8N26_06725 [Cyclobacteriaceae bacterium]|nr:hypothetical protein [Cyclobacteriaceae bacterium]
MIKTAHIILLLITLLILSHCDECDDCDGLISEPTASFAFIDSDSLLWVKNNLELLTDSLLYTDSVSDHLSLISDYLEDSLTILTDSIGNGGLLEAEQNLITDQIVWVDRLIFINEEYDAYYRTEIDTLNMIKTTLISGNVLVDTVFNLFNNQYQVFENIATQYEIPLNYNDSLSSLGFSIAGHPYFINLHHTNEWMIDMRGNASVSISKIDTVAFAHNFTNIIIQCENSSCKSNEIVFTCYY